MKNSYEWHRYFAWHPVEIRGKFAWLCWVERCLVDDFFFPFWVYRPIIKKSVV